jgi:cell division protein FtsB
MTSGRKNQLIRQALALGAILATICYVASDAVRGAHGLIANQILRARIEALQKELTTLKTQRMGLERDAKLLGSNAASQPALLDEQARSLLDLAKPTDVVIVNADRNSR